MPPKIEFEQAVNFAEALVRGKPNRDRIALTILSDKVKELVGTASARGSDSQSSFSPSWFTALGDRAAERNNEVPHGT